MAIEMGTSAPAPIAWKILAATSQVMLVVSAAATDPAMNSSIQTTYRLRCPHTSDIRPISGIAATYPSRYPVMVQDARSSSWIGTVRSNMISGRTVTMTV